MSAVMCLDLGSDVLRAAGPGGAVREARHDPHARPVHRGIVVDEPALSGALSRLVRRPRRTALLLATPAGPPADRIEASVDAVARTLHAQQVRTLPAPVAATRGIGITGSALVVDLGAELTEVSWVESRGFHVGTCLPWGVLDLHADLLAHLARRHDVTIEPDALGIHWAGSAVVARDRVSHAVRVLRITTEDLDAVLDARSRQLARLVAQIRSSAPNPHPDHVVVGGGTLVPDLRRRLLPADMQWRTPDRPTLSVLSGLLTAA